MSNHWLIARSRRWISALIVLVISALLVFGFFDLVIDLGRNIPQTDIVSDYIIGIIWAAFLGVSILAWPLPFRDRRALIVVWLIKSVITLGFMLLYEANYETLDAYSYFSDSKQNDALFLEEVGFGSGTQNISALAWLHNQAFPDSYHAMKVSFSMVGLLAIYLFYRASVIFLRRENIRVFYMLALFPSILFWSSILGKEPIILLGMALYTYGVVGWYRSRGLYYLFMIALGIALTMFIRQWMGLILLLPLIVFALHGIRGGLQKVMFAVFVVSIFSFFFNQFSEQMNIGTIQDMLETTDTISRGFATGGSGQEIAMEFASINDMVAFAPLGIFTALFRPLPGEILNPFGLLAGLENLVLLSLLLLAIKRTGWREARQPLVIWAIFLVVIWAAVYGFVSYQNLGTAVRFKLQILPVLVGLLLYLARRRSRALISNNNV